MKIRRIRFFGWRALFVLLLVYQVHGQNITAEIGSIIGPEGTLTSPTYVIDSDAETSALFTTRDNLEVSAEVTFTRNSDDLSNTEDFRLVARLIDQATGDEIPSALGGNEAIGASQSVTVDIFSPTQTLFLEAAFTPGTDLGAGKSYSLEVTVERADFVFVPGLGNLTIWVAADGPENSPDFVVVHFTDGGGAPGVFVRAYPTSGATWTQTHVVATDPARTKFKASVPYFASRYDIGGVLSSIPFQIKATLTDSDGANVPLKNNGFTNTAILLNSRTTGPFSSRPVTTTGVFEAQFEPVDQLDSGGKTYQLKLAISHREQGFPLNVIRQDGATPNTSLRRLLDYNGKLIFDQVETTITQLVSSPIAGVVNFGSISTLVNVANGTANGFPYTFSSSGNLGVQLQANGDGIVTGGVATVNEAVSADFSGLKVDYGAVTLGSGGAVTDNVLVRLPQGLGFAPFGNGNVDIFENFFEFGISTPLNSGFRHEGVLTKATGSSASVFDEARPLIYGVSSLSLTPAGELDLQPTSVRWAMENSFNTLDQDFNEGDYQVESMRYRMSNDGYLRYVEIDPSVSLQFAAASDATARTKRARLSIERGSYITQTPLNTALSWNGTGELNIVDGKVKPSGSVIGGANPLRVSYDGACQNDPCGPAAGATVLINAQPDNARFGFSPDGGVFAQVGIPSNPLRWGWKGDGNGGVGGSTHRTAAFDSAKFFAPGYQIYAEDSPLSNGSSSFTTQATTLMGALAQLAGFDQEANRMVYAETPAYQSGEGVYAGLNFQVVDAGTEGAALIADMQSEYLIKLQPEVSKYYVRQSGLSGRHVATDKGFNPEVVLYGYQFKLDKFQLTYLSDENVESWIRGGVSVPEPSGFGQRFTDLKLSCSGALETARLDENDRGSKDLFYWNGSFLPGAMSFNPQDRGGCYGDRFLTMGVITGAANVPVSLSGSIAFRPDGNIATLEDNIVGTDGRFGLPASIPVKGPGDEIYTMAPVTKLYFNDAFASGSPATGYVNFAATSDVPFFQDLQLHCMTSAQVGVPAPIYLASGWQDGSETFFTNSKFDGAHRGFPGGGVFAIDYQSPTSENNYVVRARQSIFGIITLDYPLQWDPNARFFRSWEGKTAELLVLDVEHQVKYLSADNAELTFGVEYDGLPGINLVSTAVGKGASKALTSAAGGLVTDALNDGVDEIGKLVDNTIESLLDKAIGKIELDVITPLYAAIEQSYNDAVAAGQTLDEWTDPNSGDLKVVFDRYLDGAIGPTEDSIRGKLDQLADATAGASSLVTRIDEALAKGILAIDAIAGELRESGGEIVDPKLPTPAGANQISGLLKEVDIGSGETERQIVQTLVKQLIKELAPESLASVLNPLLANLTSEINAELNALLEEFDPTLDRVSEVLLQARGYLVAVRAELVAGQDLLVSLEEIVTEAATEFDAVVNQIRNDAYDYVRVVAVSAGQAGDQVLGSATNLLAEFDREEFINLIRSELRDYLIGTNFVREIQYTLRGYVSELELALQSAIDSAFAEVNRLIKELVKEALGPIDEGIASLLGDVSKYVGAGSIQGYAHIQGDTIRRLRLDAEVELKVPDDLALKAYFEMNCFDSDSDVNGCVGEGERAVEVKIGALDVPLNWISPDLQANFEVRFSMQTQPNVRPKGIGGSLVMTGGELDFQSFKITAFGASVGIGIDEAYLAATATVFVSNYEAAGGIFFGKTCTIEPLLLVDPDVAELLGNPPFTGAYVYGEVWIPISEVILGVPASCLFRISAGVGAGAFYFVEGPTFGGKMLLGVSGEALCLVSIKGTVTLIGVLQDGSLRFRGKGRLTGKAGYCPFCKEFNKTATVTYQQGSWDVDL